MQPSVTQPVTTSANAMQLDPMRSMIMPAGVSNQMFGLVVAASLPVTPLGAYQFGRPKSPTTSTWTSTVTEKRRAFDDRSLSSYPRSTSPSRSGSSSMTCFNSGQAGQYMARQCPQQRLPSPYRPRITDREPEGESLSPTRPTDRWCM